MIESIIYIATSGANYWCGLSEQNAICTTQSQDSFDGRVLTSLKQEIGRFSQFRIGGDKLFAYDSKTRSFIYVDSTININGKGGIKLVSFGDKLLEHYAVSYIGSIPNIKSEKKLPESKIEEFLVSIQENPWLISQDILLQDNSDEFYSSLYVLDILISATLSDKKMAILVDDKDYESCKDLVRNCLYLLPVKSANSLSFTTNADASLIVNESILPNICITKCTDFPRTFKGEKISFCEIISNSEYCPKNNYCVLLKNLGRATTIELFKDCTNISDVEQNAKGRIVNVQKEQLCINYSKINKSIFVGESNEFLEQLTICKRIYNQYQDQITVDEIICCVAQKLGQGWISDVEDSSRLAVLRDYLIVVIPAPQLFTYFCGLENPSDKFVKEVIVEFVTESICDKEEQYFNDWTSSLSKLKKTNNILYNKVQKICATIFDKFYKARMNSVWRYADKDDFYDEIFKFGQAFNYTDNTYLTLKSNVEKYRRNEKIQDDYLAQFADEDNQDIKLCKSEKRRETRRNFNLGFNALSFFSILIPPVLTAAGIFLILTQWIPLEQILISLGYYSLNIFHIAFVVSAVVGLLGFVVGIVMYSVLSRAKQNLPLKVIGLRILFVEVVILIINFIFWGLLSIFCFTL